MFLILMLWAPFFHLVTKQITNSGLSEFFNDVISVEVFDCFNSSKEVYLQTAQKLQKAPNHLRLVATHDWDTHGALSAGLKAVYIIVQRLSITLSTKSQK